jgi:hypothetical protein
MTAGFSADERAELEELEARYAEADTLYNLAAVAQQTENAAELAKA